MSTTHRPPDPVHRAGRATRTSHAGQDAAPTGRSAITWTFIVTSIAAFMVALDNLVVTMALPSIREHLHIGLSQLEWTVNAYTLTFAVLLLPAAALGDRLGRRRVFSVGLTLFTVASAVAALAPNADVLVTARAVQGAGGAAVLPLSLTLLSAAVPANRRGAALGVWGAMSGLAVALGPLLGGAITQGASWQYIFWLNVPIGVVLVPLAVRKLRESHGPARSLDPVGLALVSTGLFALVFSLVRATSHGWTSAAQLSGLIGGGLLIGAFIAWERRTAEPMLPLALFRHRGFSAVNGASLLMSVGMFGSVFLIAQYFQTVRGYGPLEAGLRTLPWTAVPVLVAPIAGPLADRIGGKPLLTAGLVFQALGLGWLGLLSTTTVPYSHLLPGLVLSGLGMALFFVPVATVALGSVPVESQGMASGTNNAIRELGGVVGVAVLSVVFAHSGGYATAQTFVDGLGPAMVVGAVAVLIGAAIALLIPNRRPAVAASSPTEPAAASQQLVTATFTSASAGVDLRRPGGEGDGGPVGGEDRAEVLAGRPPNRAGGFGVHADDRTTSE
jgi:EmrB/QacA subfamily drug resistance transporter